MSAIDIRKLLEQELIEKYNDHNIVEEYEVDENNVDIDIHENELVDNEHDSAWNLFIKSTEAINLNLNATISSMFNDNLGYDRTHVNNVMTFVDTEIPTKQLLSFTINKDQYDISPETHEQVSESIQRLVDAIVFQFEICITDRILVNECNEEYIGIPSIPTVSFFNQEDEERCMLELMVTLSQDQSMEDDNDDDGNNNDVVIYDEVYETSSPVQVPPRHTYPIDIIPSIYPEKEYAQVMESEYDVEIARELEADRLDREARRTRRRMLEAEAILDKARLQTIHKAGVCIHITILILQVCLMRFC
jgi:hypothetical protein